MRRLSVESSARPCTNAEAHLRGHHGSSNSRELKHAQLHAHLAHIADDCVGHFILRRHLHQIGKHRAQIHGNLHNLHRSITSLSTDVWCAPSKSSKSCAVLVAFTLCLKSCAWHNICGQIDSHGHALSDAITLRHYREPHIQPSQTQKRHPPLRSGMYSIKHALNVCPTRTHDSFVQLDKITREYTSHRCHRNKEIMYGHMMLLSNKWNSSTSYIYSTIH